MKMRGVARTAGWVEGLLLLSTLALFGGCTASDAPIAPQPTVQSQFFPLDNGVVYTYRRFHNNRNDTVSLRLEIGQPPSVTNALVNTATNDTFYDIGFTRDADDNVAAMLRTDTSSLMVLDGTLEHGATWVADEINGIHATVLTQYDDYFLPDRKEDYTNVLVVEYHQDGEPEGNYTLRFFARDHGLILERQIVAPGTEIASLELLGIQYPS